MIHAMATQETPGDSGRAVLVVDDEIHFLSSIRFILAHLGIERVTTCDDGRRAMELLGMSHYSAVLLDVSMPYVNGIDLLPRITADYPQLPVIMVTAVHEIGTVVACIKSGAFDYICKPIEETRLTATLHNAFQITDMRRETARLRSTMTSGTLPRPELFKAFVTQHDPLFGIFSYIEAVSSSRQPVLITGETGTGKELVARAVHEASGRTGKFVPVNVGGITGNLIDDELFGHCKGAFTGAHSGRAGMIEQASGGTLFLDEIGDLPPLLQVKLLRFIQEGQYQQLGSDLVRRADSRIVVATNHDIEERVAGGYFRKDLFYRLCTHRVHLPPLRERREDLPCLIDAFLDQAARELGKKKPAVPKQLYTLLATYPFPGNVRELRCMVFDAMSLHSGGTLSMDSFRAKLHPREAPVEKFSLPTDANHAGKVHFSGQLPTLKEVQEILIGEALKAADGNQTIAAGILGMSRRALNSRLNRE